MSRGEEARLRHEIKKFEEEASGIRSHIQNLTKQLVDDSESLTLSEVRNFKEELMRSNKKLLSIQRMLDRRRQRCLFINENEEDFTKES